MIVVNKGESSVLPVNFDYCRLIDPGGLGHILKRSVFLVMKKSDTVLIK